MQNIRDTALSSSAEGNSFSYLLADTQTLNTTGLKVMRNLTTVGLIPAFCSRLNGQIRLVYDIAGFMPLSALAANLTPAKFVSIAKRLLELFIKASQNGFIRLESLLLDADHIMVDSSTAVHLIYLPVDTIPPDTSKLESPELTLRQLLIRFVEDNPNVRSERVARLCGALKNSQTPLSGTLSLLEGRQTYDRWNISSPDSSQKPSGIQLCAVNGVYSFAVSSHGLVVGRDPTRASALLNDRSVSGAHCRIFCQGDHWMVEDLGSRNGTCLNGILLSPHTPAPLAVGDTLKFSTLDFVIKEKE